MTDVLAAVVAMTPILRGDVLVVLAGEDGEARAEAVPTLLRQGAAPHVHVTGGLDEPPRLLGASRLRKHLIGLGVHPGHISVDDAPQNTREQAVRVVALAQEKGWARIILVASPYHAYRAWLTFLQAVLEAKLERTVQIVSAPAFHTSRWFDAPSGATAQRLDLLRIEYEKIERYRDLGHVASENDAVRYLCYWEGRS